MIIEMMSIFIRTIMEGSPEFAHILERNLKFVARKDIRRTFEPFLDHSLELKSPK